MPAFEKPKYFYFTAFWGGSKARIMLIQLKSYGVQKPIAIPDIIVKSVLIGCF